MWGGCFWNSRLGGTDIHNPAIYWQREQERYSTAQSWLLPFLTKLLKRTIFGLWHMERIMKKKRRYKRKKNDYFSLSLSSFSSVDFSVYLCNGPQNISHRIEKKIGFYMFYCENSFFWENMQMSSKVIHWNCAVSHQKGKCRMKKMMMNFNRFFFFSLHAWIQNVQFIPHYTQQK